jgi:DNA segregation ATPase FtsK/SpoIIIE, S-DNA-T family
LGTSLTEEQVQVFATLVSKMRALQVDASPLPTVTVGPVVSVYRFEPKGSTRISQLEGLSRDFALALNVEDVLVKRMPGDSAVGVFVPNKERKGVTFLETISYVWPLKDKLNIPLNLGITQLGDPLIEDLSTLPHLLVAGSTGSGKSTLLSSIITTIVATKSADEVRLVLSDTNGVEFGHFIGAPHLVFEPATSVYKTLDHIEWLSGETNDRLAKFAKASCRNITEFNLHATLKNKLPFLVLIIDEIADMMLHKHKNEDEKVSVSKLFENNLCLLVGRCRKAGIHVIASTQRPSVNIVTGSIKANFPARLSLKLPSAVDSRTILDTEGAEHLLVPGDMLYQSPLRAELIRAHAPITRNAEIVATIEAILRTNS